MSLGDCRSVETLARGYAAGTHAAAGARAPPARTCPTRTTPERWLELYLEDRTGLGSWCQHLASWWPERERSNVLLLTLAELKADLPGQIGRIADHLGVDLTETERAAVIERSSFSWMKGREAAFSPPVPRLRAPEQLARIDQVFRQRLLALGCDAPYDPLFPR